MGIDPRLSDVRLPRIRVAQAGALPSDTSRLAVLEGEVRALRALVQSLTTQVAVANKRIRAVVRPDAAGVAVAPACLDLGTMLEEVASEADLPVAAILGPSKNRDLAAARFAFCERAVDEGWAQADIGTFLGKRNPGQAVSMILHRGRKVGY